jgi:hypothetical protein
MPPTPGKKLNSRPKSGNAYYHTVQNILSSHFLPKNIKLKISRTIILPNILYRFETLSLTLREEHKLRVFKNRVLQEIFGPKKDDVTRDWSKLHNAELHNFYTSPNSIQVIIQEE